MTMPQTPMNESVSWTDTGRWRPRVKERVQLGRAKLIMEDCRAKDQVHDDSTVTADGVVGRQYTQGKVINGRTMRGAGCGPPDLTAEGINNDIMTESNGSQVCYWRHMTTGISGFTKERNQIYSQSWPNDKTLCIFPNWVRVEVSVKHHQKAETIPRNQRTRGARPSLIMETRQKLRQVEENQSVGEDSRRRKGKIIMQQDPPFAVLEIEDDSDEDPALDDGSNRRYHRKNSTEEGKEQMEADFLCDEHG